MKLNFFSLLLVWTVVVPFAFAQDEIDFDNPVQETTWQRVGDRLNDDQEQKLETYMAECKEQT